MVFLLYKLIQYGSTTLFQWAKLIILNNTHSLLNEKVYVLI